MICAKNDILRQVGKRLLDCGKPTVGDLGNSPVVVFGETATRENFPWHAGNQF